MTFLRTVSALAVALLLTACGGQADTLADTSAPMQLASVVTSTTGSADTPAISGAAAGAQAAAAQAGAIVASTSMPAPDCAAEGCASLRIIDGNAEAWRIDAQRRAELDARL